MKKLFSGCAGILLLALSLSGCVWYGGHGGYDHPGYGDDHPGYSNGYGGGGSDYDNHPHGPGWGTGWGSAD